MISMKNQIKKIALAISLLWGILSYGQGVKVKFFNKTGFDLDSLAFKKIYIGALPKDQATSYLTYESLYFNGDNRSVAGWNRSDGYIKSMKKYVEPADTYHFSTCATGSYTETSGTFLFDINLRIFAKDGTYVLYLSEHT